MSDYYSTLGVDRGASAEEIKKAYRKMAGKHHPDRGGDKAKFQEVEEAYRTLSDDQKRAAYDNPSPFGNQNPFAQESPGGFQFHFGPGGFQFNDIFGMFNQGNFANQQRQMRMSLWIRLYDVVVGGKRPVSIATASGSTVVEIDIPTGINDGDNVRYPGIAPGNADLIVQFRIHPDPTWSRQDLNLITDRTIDIWDLILGNDITITDLLGNQLVATIPPKTQPKSILRIRNQGIRDRQGRTGDIMIRIDVKIPDNISPELIAAIKQYR